MPPNQWAPDPPGGWLCLVLLAAILFLVSFAHGVALP